MVRLGILIYIWILIGCEAIDKSDQKFKFPDDLIEPAPAPLAGDVETNSSISILGTTIVSLGSGSTPGNIVYDGVRLLWLKPLNVGNCFPGDVATFQYMDSDFTAQTTSSSSYAGLSSSISCNGRSFPAFSTTVGQSAMFWIMASGTSGKLSIRDDSTGTVLSTTNINVADYGCTTNMADSGDGPLITYCNGLYYGACTSSTNFLRFFSFDSSGAMQSAVTTTESEFTYGKLNAITCYDSNSLILVTNYSTNNAYNGFYKYNLSFSKVSTDGATSYQFPTSLRRVVGMATDGANLYLQGEVDYSTSPPVVTFGKASLGNLK